jgi:Ca2+-binding RTX toxin-like protein
VQLTANDSWDSLPDWSPDGTQIAFVSDRVDGDYGHIYVMGADGSDPRRITVEDEYASYPAWSPDGTRIAFDGGEDDSYLDVVNADGTDRVRLTPEGSATHPAWTPDGRIAFTGGEDDYDIEVMNADGSGRRPLVATSAGERRVAISPDGSRLAFDSDADEYSQVFIAAADGSAIRRLTGPRRAFAAGTRCSIVGTAGRDVLRGTSADDVMCGLGGNDRILGLAGDDTIDGGQGDDVVEGGAGTDHVLGNTGADRLVGGAQEDRLEGGPGTDLLLTVDGRRDHADGGPGRDRARIDPGDWVSFLETLL